MSGGTQAGVAPARSFDLPAAVGFGLPFLIVIYLAFAGGGYDGVVYGEAGIVCWWVVLLGALVGVLPFSRISRGGWVALALLGGFALWTALGISWSASSEKSVAELGRVASFLGVFALAISIQGRRDGLRRTLYGVAAAIAVIAAFSLMSRFHPELFPKIAAAQFLDDIQARLSYPLNYWNGLAALMAIGLPLCFTVATFSRRAALQALAAAAVPVIALTAYFTLSRGGVFEIGAAVIAILIFHPRRLSALISMAIMGAGSGVLIAVASTRGALQDGLNNSTAISQGNEMLVLTVVVCALVALGQLALWRAHQNGFEPQLPISRRAAWTVAGIVVAVVLIGAIGAGAPSKISNRVDEFTKAEAPDPNAGASRYASLSGNGRYQLWSSAADANATDPLIGIGPGDFEYWWAQHRTIDAYSLSAHSLYMNTLAELGIIGLLLIAAFVLLPIGAGIRLWQRLPESRELLAGALAAAIAFAVAAGIERVWELAVLPACFFLIAAAILMRRGDAAAPATVPAPLPVSGRLAVLGASILGVVLIAIPTATLSYIRDSQSDANSGNLAGALDNASKAGDIEPYAATPDYQRAAILEQQGNLAPAAAAARLATQKEATNWRTWLLLARIEAEQGNAEQALRDYRHAHSLNPLSDFFRE